MSSIFSYIKEKKITIIFICALMIFGVPCVIHILFKLKSNNIFLVAEWSAGDVLQYYASVLTFLSTTFLSIAALHFGEKTQIENNKRNGKIYVGLEEKGTVKISYYENQCKIEMKFINYGKVLPEFGAVKDLVVHSKYCFKEKEAIDGKRNAFCSIKNVRESDFNLIISFFYGVEKIDNTSELKKRMYYLNHGLATEDEVCSAGERVIVLQLGLYSGGIVTPLRITLYLKWNTREQKDDFYIVPYVIDNYDIYTGSPMLEGDYEKQLK